MPAPRQKKSANRAVAAPEIAASIRRLLEAKDLRIKDIVDELHLPQSTVQSWAADGTQNLEVLADLDDFCEVGRGTILRGCRRPDGSPYIEDPSIEDLILANPVLLPKYAKIAIEQIQWAMDRSIEEREREQGRASRRAS